MPDKTLIIDGSSEMFMTADEVRSREKFLVIRNEHECWLPYQQFLSVALLALARVHNEDGWLKLTEINQDEKAAYTALWRLRKLIDIEIENKKRGEYRFVLSPEEIGFNGENLAKFPVHAISHRFSKEN